MMEKFKFEEYLPAGKGTLRFTAEIGDVTIEGHDSDQLLVEGEGRYVTPILSREENIITVRIEVQKVKGLLKRPKANVHVYVPLACHVDAKTVTGQQTIRNLATPLNARVVTGNQRLENITGAINAKTVTGQLTYRGALTDEAHTFATVTGRLQLALSEPPNATIDAKTITGGIHSDFELSEAIHRKNIVGARLKGVVGKGAGSIRARVVTGSLQLTETTQAPKVAKVLA